MMTELDEIGISEIENQILPYSLLPHNLRA